MLPGGNGALAGVIALLPLLASAGSRAHHERAPSVSEATTPSDSVTRVQMQNVDFFVDPRIALRIRHLTGTMRSKVPGPIQFDNRSTFSFNVESAEVGMTADDLSELMNRYVFNYKGSPLSHIRITIANGEIIQKGILKKAVSLPFEIHAQLTATSDGRIRLHPVRTEILGMHVDKLMHGLGLSLEKIINLSRAKGATVDGNDIYLSPTMILPPPEIHGLLAAAAVVGDRVIMRFGNGEPGKRMQIPLSTATNYMYYRGGTLRFGKLVMLDADMLITDLDPKDPFKFELDRYQPQLVAGYERTLSSGGLIVWMPDLDRVKGALQADNSVGSDATLQGTAPAPSR